jgi:acetylornithine deacetylase
LAHATVTKFPIEHGPPYMAGPPLSDEHNGRLGERLSRVACETVGRCRRLSVPYCTNAPFFAATGMPAVIFGPGFLEQAHTADEWTPMEQVRQAAEILYRFCRTFAAGPT